MNKMKRKSIIGMLLLGMMVGISSTSCQDMLSPDSERHSYSVAQDTLYSYWGILKSLQNIAERYVILNECRGDLVDQTSFVSDTIGAIVEFGNVSNPEKTWKDGACAYLKISDYYHIINSCNAYIYMCDTTRTTGTNKKFMLAEYAQVQAIRAWVYMQLLYAYGPDRVPFYKTAMLTTDAINSYVADANCPKVNARVLADELGPELEDMEKVEGQTIYDLPSYGYNNYGDVDVKNSHYVCHSSKCMFPVSIVLGDLYLLSGDYEKSARHYFEYLKSENCGALSANDYISYGDLDDKKDYPLYNYDRANIPYTETGKVSVDYESITCIPSNKGKLEGRVNTDICRLFGFEAQLRTSTSEEAGASIGLSRNYERELIPSRGYEALCDSQTYEIYVGSVDDKTKVFTPESIEEMPGVGDARRAWIYNRDGEQWNFYVGDDIYYGKMVSKQNPQGVFSTVYPMVYRKSTVWLRYAEALNRAGFPSYAFAVLKNGLCNNSMWFPEDPAVTYKANNSESAFEIYPLGSYDLDYYYKVKDTLYYYFDRTQGESGMMVPTPSSDVKLTTLKEFAEWLATYFQDEYTASLETENPMDEPRKVEDVNVNDIYWRPAGADAFSNTPNNYTTVACKYLDRRELVRAASLDYMDFKKVAAHDTRQKVYFKEQGKLLTKGDRNNYTSYSGTSSTDRYTIGVHQRGCGTIFFDDPVQFGLSSYSYVGMVQKKIKEATGREVTEDEIYSGTIDEEVKDAVEDLIIDEMGLELAFEGTRFSDLYRVAQRRGDANYLAERVSKRHTGKVDENVRSWLLDKNHWFLPIPEE